MAEPFKEKKSGNYFVSFCYKGRRFKRSTGSPDLARARRRHRLVDGKVEQLKAGLVELPAGVSVADFVFDGKTEADDEAAPAAMAVLLDAYLVDAAPPNKAASTYLTERIHIDHLREFLAKNGVTEVEGLTPALFEHYKRQRHRDGAKNVTVNKELGTFRTMLNWAVRSDILERNPLDDVKWLKEDDRFERFRTGDEIKELLESGQCSEEEAARLRRFRYLAGDEIGELLKLAEGTGLHALLATAAFTGMRLGELLRLGWSDIDFASGRILARGHKGSTSRRESPRYIPLHEKLAEVLSERKKHVGESTVFTGTDGAPLDKGRWYRLIKKVTDGTDFEGVRFHALRHSFASNLAAQGVDQRVIDRFMGHQTEAMRKRYQHLFPDKQQEAIHKLDF